MVRVAWLFACFIGVLLETRLAHSENAIPVVALKPTVVEGVSPLHFTGTVTSRRFAALSPYVDGLVISADVDEGHVARRGEVLLVLDATFAKLRLAEARARLDEAKARLGDVQRLRAEAEKLGQNISQSTLLSRMSEERIEAAVVARLMAELKFQAELVERHTMRAPFDGVVVDKLTEVGEWAESSRPVLEFLATDQLRLDIQVPQDYYPMIRYQSSALVRVDAFPRSQFTGQVVAIVPASDPDGRTFLIRLHLDDPSHEIIAGMSAVARFGVSDGKNALEIPRDAVVRYPDGSTSVWVVEENGNGPQAYERQVVLGDAYGGMVKVTQGLDHLMVVVVRGNEMLDEGAVVRLVDRLPGRSGAADMPK